MNRLDTAIQHWDTSTVQPTERLSYWVDAICDAFLAMQCDSEALTRFQGELSRLAHPQMNFNRVLASAQHVSRTAREIGASTEAPFYFICDTGHAWRVVQDGQCKILRPGDAVLLDSSRPYELIFPNAVACLSLEIPRHSLAQWLACPETKNLRVTRFDQGCGGAVAAMSHQLVRDLASASAWQTTTLVDHMGALLSAALEPTNSSSDTPSHDLCARAVVLMQSVLMQDLTVQHVAHELGVSVRSLQRAFAARQQTFQSTLQSLRLQRAAQLLRLPSLRHVNTAEIGRRCGFLDPSHFVRAFVAMHGHTPLRWRQMAEPN